MARAKNHSPADDQFLLYTAANGAVRVDVLFKDESAWLTQKALAELFGVKVPAIGKHLKNIFESRELAEDSVVSILETTAADGKKYQTRSYNLDAIIAVGYRVNSYQATQFRIWATKTLREYIVKGFVLDDERMKRGNQPFGKDYFDELLERIREIRASERLFHQKSPTSTRSLWTTAWRRRSPRSSSRRCRTSCTGRSPARRQPSSSTARPTQPSSAWA